VTISLRILIKVGFFIALINSRVVWGQNEHNNKNQTKSLGKELYEYYCLGLIMWVYKRLQLKTLYLLFICVNLMIFHQGMFKTKSYLSWCSNLLNQYLSTNLQYAFKLVKQFPFIWEFVGKFVKTWLMETFKTKLIVGPTHFLD